MTLLDNQVKAQRIYKNHMQNQFKTSDDRKSQNRMSYGSKRELKEKQSHKSSRKILDPALDPSKNILVSDSVIKNATPDNVEENQDVNAVNVDQTLNNKSSVEIVSPDDNSKQQDID